MSYRGLHNRLNGRLTAGQKSFSYEVAKAQYGSNHWSVTENNRNNARNVNFNNGNVNNNNKNNNNRVRFVRDMEILSMTIWLNLSGSQMLIWVNCIMDIVLAGSGNATPYRNRNFHSI